MRASSRLRTQRRDSRVFKIDGAGFAILVISALVPMKEEYPLLSHVNADNSAVNVYVPLND